MKRGKSGVAIAVILAAVMLSMFAFTACDHESDSNYYTATFVADGETVDEVEFTVEDEALTEPTVPSKVGYIGEWQEYDIVAEDITVEAVYTAIVYGIEYVGLEDGTHSNASEYTIESATIVLQDASRVGYDFVGWYDGEQEVTEIASGSTGDKTLTAKWQAIGYTIAYEGLADGTHSNASEYTIESETIVLQDASREGYDFIGWYDGEQEVTEIVTGSHGDIVLTAKWQIAEYSVDYVLDGGVNAASNPSRYTVLTLGGADGSIALADPSKKGEMGYTSNGDGSIEVTQNVYTFLGWYKDASFEQEVDSLTLDLGDVTLYAKWSEPTSQTTETVQVYTREGDYIYFGEYPQTIKSSDVTVGDVVVADPWGSGNTFSDGSAVTEGNTYYFKVEPIRWRILSESDGSAFILADGIIANHYYHHTLSRTTIEGETVYANNYKHSDIRAWLNDEFLNAAFGEAAQMLIEITEVDNSVYSTGNSSSNEYACENTFDKVFLLSYREVTDSAYGFAISSTYDTARRMTVSDYARSTGAYMYTSSSYFGCGLWWLRSPDNRNGYYARRVSDYGYAGGHNYVDHGDHCGVVPALNIIL